MTDPVARTKATYDVLADEFARTNATPWPELNELMSAFLVRLPERARVLDAGCGPGRDTRSLRARGARVLGLDLSFGMLRSESLSGAAQADMRALPVADAAVDGVWCQAALLHIPRTEVPGVLAGFARVTRPGGALHLAVSEGDGEGWSTVVTNRPSRVGSFTIASSRCARCSPAPAGTWSVSRDCTITATGFTCWPIAAEPNAATAASAKLSRLAALG